VSKQTRSEPQHYHRRFTSTAPLKITPTTERRSDVSTTHNNVPLLSQSVNSSELIAPIRLTPSKLAIDKDPDAYANKRQGLGPLGLPDLYQDLESALRDEKPTKRASDGLRHMMRHMPHSVVVVTACRETDSPLEPIEDPENYPPTLSPFYKDFCGVTISSMTSVTLGPPAIVSFNLRIPSKTLSGILQHKVFRIHLLGALPSGAEVAHAFTKQKHADSFKYLAERGRWIGVGNRPVPDEIAPLIDGKGVKARLLCRVMPEKCIEVGDHMVVIATVEKTYVNPDDHGEPSFKPQLALMYSNQSYKRHGEIISMPDSPELPCSQPKPTATRGLKALHKDLEVMESIEKCITQPEDSRLMSAKIARWVGRTQGMLAPAYLHACLSINKEVLAYPSQHRPYLTAILLDELGKFIRNNPETRPTDMKITPEIQQAANRLQITAETETREEDAMKALGYDNSHLTKNEANNEEAEIRPGKPWWYI
jgi:flavin reductase (DIM6/NTAB) family NADH-FMN oxidoreductase RutF